MSLRAILLFGLLLPFPAAAQSTDDCDISRLARVVIQTSAFPSLPGQSVTIHVFVEPVQGTANPIGDVQLSDGPDDLGTLPLVQSQVTITRTFVQSGAHTIRAAYSGDYNYCSVTGVFGQQVNHLTPTVTLSSSANSSSPNGPSFGTPITLTAQISPPAPAGVASPVGPVQFLEGTTVLGSATPVGGKASVTLLSLAPGSHQIVAMLVGDAVWFQVRSAALIQNVAATATVTTLTASAGITDTTLSAVVTANPAGAVPPDGSVQFMDTVRNAVLGSATIPAGGAAARVTITAAQVLASVGHAIGAVYSGSTSFAPSTSNLIGIPVAANSAGASVAAIAPDEIVSLYGWNLADNTQLASVVPLPSSLNGYSVTVTDSAGTNRTAGMYLISPGQFNFVVPTGTVAGTATITINAPSARASLVPIRVNVATIAPGIFTLSSDGKGTPAAQLIRVSSNGTQTTEPVTDAGIRIGTDVVYLVLYGTGIRNRSSLAAVSCTIGGQDAAVSYAGPQPDSPGLDQVNVRLLPLAGRPVGDAPLNLTVDGQAANPVTLRIIG